MKTMLRHLSVAAAMTAAAVALPAQTKTVAQGHATFSSSSFLKYVASFGVTVTDLGGAAAVNTPETFPVAEGQLDLKTGAGEIATLGGYILSGNGNTVRIVDLTLDSTNPSSPVVTALFIVNDNLVGRRPLYQVTVPSGITLPLKPQGAVEQLNGLGLTLTQAAASTINSAIVITEPVLQPGESGGTLNVYAVLRPITPTPL